VQNVYPEVEIHANLISGFLDQTIRIDLPTQMELKFLRQALKHYREQAWDLSETMFQNVQQQAPDRMLYKMYMDRISHFRNNPPGKDWDGVYTHTAK
jgi:adenylate cyclase